MDTRYIFVTGGVTSSLGKGITAASLGRLLKARGYTVAIQKFDPYLNIDPGTMNPYQHGEVFVTEDGAETDLDLGHYERFVDENLTPLFLRHLRAGLFQRLKARARRRLPRRHRAGHPAHHRRDQGENLSRRRKGRRRHHRNRRNGRRYRGATLHRGHPPISMGSATGAHAVYPRHPHPVPENVAGTQNQAHAALGQGIAGHGHPPRHARLPQRLSHSRRRCAAKLSPVLQCPRQVHHPEPRRRIALSGALDAGAGSVRRQGLRSAATARPRSRTCRTGRKWSTASSTPSAK